MKRAVLVAGLVLVSVHTAWAGSGREQLRQAMGSVMADTLSDTTEVTDRLGCVHRVYADSSKLWYQTSELGPDGSPAIEIAQGDVSSPTSYLSHDTEYGWTLVVVWLERTDHGPAVCCRRRVLVQPFWVWSMPLDVTPQRRDRP